jgi:hypothetical protein
MKDFINKVIGIVLLYFRRFSDIVIVFLFTFLFSVIFVSKYLGDSILFFIFLFIFTAIIYYLLYLLNIFISIIRMRAKSHFKFLFENDKK